MSRHRAQLALDAFERCAKALRDLSKYDRARVLRALAMVDHEAGRARAWNLYNPPLPPRGTTIFPPTEKL